MAESNPTQVILTDDGIKIIKAQSTANNAASQASKADSAALIAQSKANAAKSAADSSYKYANSEIAVQSNATAKAQSTADNAFSKAQAVGSQASAEIKSNSTATAKAQSTADNAFSKAQAVGSQASAEINRNSTATVKAQSTADSAFSKAQEVGSQASAEIAKNSTATVKAQSTADNAFSQATTAIDTGKVTSQAVTDLKDGSKLTIAELENGLATKVANSEYASYKEQTASQIGQLVTNGAFSAYQTQTADLIAQKVATSDFSAYQATTAKSIDSKVEYKDFNTYKTQTADLIDDKVSNSAYASDKTQTASEIADRVSNSAFSTYQTQTASQIASKVDNGAFSTYKTQTADLIAQKVATSDFSAYQATTAKEISSKVESNDFNTYKTQTADTLQTLVSRSPSNIIKDGGFNSAVVGKVPSGWDFSGIAQIAVNSENTDLVAHGRSVLQINSKTSGNSDIYYGDWFDVQPGDQFYAELKTRWSSMSQKGQIRLGVVTKNSAGQWTWTSAVTVGSPSNWAKHTGVLTIPAGAVQGRVWVSWQWPAVANESVLVTDLVVRPAYATQSQITQLSGEIEQKVDSGDFSTYKTQTADLISSKVATKDFSAYQATTAKSIESKVESKDFNTYKSQTDKAILSKVSSIDFNNLTISNRNLALGTATPFKMTGTGSGYMYHLSRTIAKGTTVTVSFDIEATNATGNYTIQFVGGSYEGSSWYPIASGTQHHSYNLVLGNDYDNGVKIRSDDLTGTVTVSNLIISESSKEVSWTPAPEDQATQSQFTQLSSEIEQKVNSGDFSTYKSQTADLIAEKVATKDFSTYQKQTADLISEKVATKDFTAYQNTTAKAISSKVESSDFNTYKSQTASVISSKVANSDFSTYKTQTAKDINLRVTKGGLIDEINLQAGNTLISSSGQLTLSGKNIYFDTVNPVIIPSANIIGTLNGKTINAGTINGSTINGSTINGTTFHGGDIINNANNTAQYYPMTITPDGSYKSTYFDSAVGLQSSVESGAITYKYRSMIGNGTYSYDNVAINGQGITLDSGTTTTKDTNFSASETETAYISLTTEAGLYLHGSNANIDFGGHLSDDSTSVGMYMNPYGNLIAKSASQYWQISVAGSDNTGGGVVARFGIDNASAYNIEFNRELDIGNFQINTGHTITSTDNGAIHFAKRRGGAVDIYAGAVHYNSLVKSSLLSVKRDVQKADTAYWAQLVNSIDLATYQYKSDDNTSHLRLSSIVDDVNDTKQWQLPDVFVSRDENGKLCGVDDSVLLNATLATVQEQQKEIDQLNGHNMELEARLNKLEAK